MNATEIESPSQAEPASDWPRPTAGSRLTVDRYHAFVYPHACNASPTLANASQILCAPAASRASTASVPPQQDHSDNEVEDGPAAGNGERTAQPLPALSSVHSDRQQTGSQMAVLEQPGRAALEFDSAASPSQPRRNGDQRQHHQQQDGGMPGAVATPPGLTGEGGGSPGDAGAATPFDNVLSVLDRIKRRQSTPFTLQPGRQPAAYSPVPFGSGIGEGAQRGGSRLGGRALTPYAGGGGGPQRFGHSRLAPYSAPRPAARQQQPQPVLQFGVGGGGAGLFGDEQQAGTPGAGGDAIEAQGRPQPGGLFAQTAGTPTSSTRFARSVMHPRRVDSKLSTTSYRLR